MFPQTKVTSVFDYNILEYDSSNEKKLCNLHQMFL